jgi:AcrR family transcriptional regulator
MASAPTREKLMAAAAELIAELGWGRVTTRAVAERAGLPHGAVSYHFRGKQELLTEAALHVFAQAFPISELRALEQLPDLVALFEPFLGEQSEEQQLVSRVGTEAMLEAERNPLLRQRLAELLTTSVEQWQTSPGPGKNAGRCRPRLHPRRSRPYSAPSETASSSTRASTLSSTPPARSTHSERCFAHRSASAES